MESAALKSTKSNQAVDQREKYKFHSLYHLGVINPKEKCSYTLSVLWTNICRELTAIAVVHSLPEILEIIGKKGEKLMPIIQRNSPEGYVNIASIQSDLTLAVGEYFRSKFRETEDPSVRKALGAKKTKTIDTIQVLLEPLFPPEDLEEGIPTWAPDKPEEAIKKALDAAQSPEDEAIEIDNLVAWAPDDETVPAITFGTRTNASNTLPASTDINVNQPTKSGTRRRAKTPFNTQRLIAPLLAGAALLGGVTAVSILTTEAQRDHFYARIEKVLHLK